MRLSISNLAWDVSEDQLISELLNGHKVDAIDVAPGKYFLEPKKATDSDIATVRSWWMDRSIEIVGMQALLFGTVGLNIFGSNSVQTQMLDHLSAICRIGSGLGATKLVFGSPKCRDRGTLSDSEVVNISSKFFEKLGNIAQSYNVIICLEPNPSHYGANFMMNTEDTVAVVKEINHPAIMMQLDLGAMTINSELPITIEKCAKFIGHIHASEPDLIPLGDFAKSRHEHFSNSIKEFLPNHIVTIEMLASKTEPHQNAITRALTTARKFYGK